MPAAFQPSRSNRADNVLAVPLADRLPTEFRRIVRLGRRFRQDGRLPPAVKRLYVETLRLRLADALGRNQPGEIDDFGRRGPVEGPIDRSLHRLGQEQVIAVADALDAVGVDYFLVDRRRDGWTIGVAAPDRARAWDALVRGTGPGWRAVLRRGGRRHRHVVARGPTVRRRAARSTEWVLGRLWHMGDRLVGETAAIEVTFWDIGASGMLERLGARGQERFEPDSPTTVEPVGDRQLRGRAAFPIARGAAHLRAPVDIVYTWVDGSDPMWRASKDEWSRRSDGSVDPVGRHGSRFESRDELRYSMRSVWLYAGWVRHIYIVTAGQVPGWLATHDDVTVVDHAQILPAEVLPTFNSHAIESALHHIDGLSERFLYFNDDVFLGRSVRPEDFFTPAGAPRVFMSDARVDSGRAPRTASVDSAARRGQALLADEFGTIVSRRPAHGPFALRRAVLREMERRFGDAFEATRAHRFRHPDDVSVASALAHHFGLLSTQAVEGDLAIEYVAVESPRLGWHLDRLRLGDLHDAFCLNATGLVDTVSERNEQLLRAFLDDRFPLAAPWERPCRSRT